MLSFLRSLPDGSSGRYCMVGFRLGNTLSDFGGVTRGICLADAERNLLQVRETRNIVKTPEGAAVMGGEMLDVDAFTGGFNLQIAFTTGHCAGASAAQDALDG